MTTNQPQTELDSILTRHRVGDIDDDDAKEEILADRERAVREASVGAYTKGWRNAYKEMHDTIDWSSRSITDKPCSELTSKESE